MSRFVGLRVAVLIIAIVAVANATTRRDEGDVLFEFAAHFEGSPRVGQPISIGFMVLDFTGLADSTTIDAAVELPRGWDLVEGDVARTIRTARGELNWKIIVRPTKTGRFDIRRRLRIDRGKFGVDEGEYSQEVDLQSDSTIVGASKPIRLEKVRGGRRFRYADAVLVPIDGPEAFVQGDLTERARVVGRQTAKCTGCTASDPDVVSWVVFIGPNGCLKQARLSSPVDARSQVATVARAALDRWVFAPGEVRGRAVTDWLIVHVPVSKEP